MRPVAKKYKMNFGYLWDYPEDLKWVTKDGKHHGLDYLVPKGTSVIASMDGVINFVGYLRGFGNCVIIKFWQGFALGKTTFRVILAHLDVLNPELKIGAKISKWQEIGKSGDSGYAKNHPHLHFECQKLEKGVWIHVDPNFITGDK